MDRFVSRFTKQIDAKGRVSIPAPFRSALSRDGYEGLFCYPALSQSAIDAGGTKLIADIETLLEELDKFSDEYEQFALALYGDSHTLKIDSGGRIILPDELKAHAGITDQVIFVGCGTKFQIWEPGQFATYQREAKALVRQRVRQRGTAISDDIA